MAASRCRHRGSSAAGVAVSRKGAATFQDPTKIGVLISGSQSTGLAFEAFRSGLKDLGWVEGSDLVIEARFGDGDAQRLDPLAAELAEWKPDLIFAPTSLTALAARRAAPSVPIVFATSIDPFGPGLITSLARPGRNMTGLTTIGAELGAKRLQLLRDCVPSLKSVAVLNEVTPSLSPEILNIILAAGRQLGIAVSVLNANDEAEIRAAFERIARERPGGLMSYGVNYVEQFRRAAGYADKILKGASTSDIPVQQPTKFELLVNIRAARSMDIKVPQAVLLRADRLIE